MLLYGTSIIPFTYVASFVFDSHTTAQNVMLMAYIFVGALLLIASSFLNIVDSTKDINAKLLFIYRIFPSFCFGEAVWMRPVLVHHTCSTHTQIHMTLSSHTKHTHNKFIWHMGWVGSPHLISSHLMSLDLQLGSTWFHYNICCSTRYLEYEYCRISIVIYGKHHSIQQMGHGCGCHACMHHVMPCHVMWSPLLVLHRPLKPWPIHSLYWPLNLFVHVLDY